MLFSVVIPLYNEEEILVDAVEELHGELTHRFAGNDFEILLVENGSSDATPSLCAELDARYSGVRALHCPQPDYGAALKMGILEARGEYVVGDEIDLGDISFYERALTLLQEEDLQMIVGSKALPDSGDDRPAVRRAATRTINLMLRVVLGFQGTDTHGLKVFHRESLLPVVRSCLVGKDLFASELVIRAERAGIRILEIPVALHEKRPTAIHLFRRVPGVFRGLYQLYRVLGPRR